MKFNDLIASETPVLIDFSAEWCGPCKALKPILQEVKDKLGKEIEIVKIDVDKNQGLASQYQVHSVPTLLLFQGGQLLWRQAGVIPAFQLIDLIKKNMIQ